MNPIIPRNLIQHLEWTPRQPQPELPRIVTPTAQELIFTIDDLINRGQPFYSDKQDSQNRYIGVPIAMREALAHASVNGAVASMPYHIAGKAKADKNNYLWKDWFTALSEENVGIDKQSGKPVVIVVHGGGILTPDRIEQAYAEGLTPQNAARYTENEFDELLKGKLPTGDSIDLYTVDDVRKGRIPNLFVRYGVMLDLETAKAVKYDHKHQKGEFVENPLVLARVGTKEHLDSYFEKAKHSSQNYVHNWHRFAEIDPQQPQGRVLFLYDSCSGLSGDSGLNNDGRFVGVAPEAHGAKK